MIFETLPGDIGGWALTVDGLVFGADTLTAALTSAIRNLPDKR